MGTSVMRGYGYGLLAVAIWTGFILASRKGGMSALHYTDMMAIRYSVASLVLLPCWWFGQRFNLLAPRFVIIGMVGGLAYAICAFQGFASVPGSHAAVLLAGTMPLMIMILGALINRERQSAVRWAGVAVISLGILALGGDTFLASGQLAAGHGWFLLAAFFWSLFSVGVKRWRITPWQAVVSLAFNTSTLYLPVYILLDLGNLGAAYAEDILLQAVYQGILATIIQMFCYVNAVRLIGPSSMGSLMALVPLSAGLLSVWLFSEPVTVALVTALCLVSAGCWLANYSQSFTIKRRSSCPTST
ncbi:MAG: DMT family transporter [Ketobacteraceae bacterium]|nr:DMT family transporter [Ketobacteraceae bacterium]